MSEKINYIQLHEGEDSPIMKIIEQVKKESGIKSNTNAVRFIILQYKGEGEQ